VNVDAMLDALAAVGALLFVVGVTSAILALVHGAMED
jgi:hypothetical protein